MKTGLHLYQTLVRPHLERTYPLWCTAKQKDQDKIERVHRQALLRVTRAMGTTATAALEIIAGCMPIQCRLDVVLETEICKILAKDPTDELHQAVHQGLTSLSGHTILTPLHIYKSIIARFPHKEYLNNLEKEPVDSLDRLLYSSANIEERITGLGSTGSRDKEQAARARSAAEEYINNIPPSAIITYTDGSALGNPGPCGSAAVCYLQGKRSGPVTLAEPVSTRSTSYHAELFAIYLALQYFVESKVYEFSNIAYILSDCQAAITSSCSSNIHTSHQILIDSIRSSIHTLTLKGMKITFNWIAGHVNLQRTG